jgi:hypothetical protein
MTNEERIEQILDLLAQVEELLLELKEEKDGYCGAV